MKISFVATVLNEEESILQLLKSLESQTQKPDEVIIVDGGSTDSTVKIIKDFHEKSVLEVKHLVKKANRSRGRNLGIGQAKGQGIVVSDAGCVLDKRWLEKISKPLKDKKADVVSGFYRMKTNSLFTHCSAPFLGVMSHNINEETFIPSSRSIAFTKQAWKKVGGYPSWLNYAEDLIFAQNLHDHEDITMVTRKSALVEWNPPKNIKSFFKSIKNYTRGNIKAGYKPHLKKNILVAVRYAFALPFISVSLLYGNNTLMLIATLLTLTYFLYPSVKFYKQVRGLFEIFCFAALQLTADLAVLTALFTIKKTKQ